MRDPLTWSLPLGRYFGVFVRVHFLFPIMAAGLIMRAASQKDALPGIWIEATYLMGLLFIAVLLHELGHCLGAQWVDGEAHDVLIWPFGGLAFPEVPHTPRANFIAAAAGPAVNLVLCLIVVAVLASQSFLPSFKPWSDPFFPVLYNWSEGTYYGSKSANGDLWRFTGYKDKETNHWVSADEIKDVNDPHDPKTGKELVAVHDLNPERAVRFPENGKELKDQFWVWEDKEKDIRARLEAAQMPLSRSVWLVMLSRVFWVSWMLMWLNFLPAFPLDGGRMLQAIWWAQTDYRQSMLMAVFVGFLMMFVVLLYAIVAWEQVMPFILVVIIYLSCRRQWILLETGGEESVFGYDFSQGYASLEKDQPAGTQPPPRKLTWWQRWRQKRLAQKIQRETEQRAAEERRLDELLEKVQRLGWQGLTDEEQRFLTRVSAKYRNRK